jgi:hypothetical protein
MGYDSIDPGSSIDPVDLTYAEQLRSRVEALIDLFSSRTEAARVAAKNPDMITGYIRGRNKPPFDVLARLALAQGVSLDWVATGVGEMRPGASETQNQSQAMASPAGAIDEDLMAKIVDGISRTYKDEGARITPSDLGRLAARIHTDLAAAYDDPDDRKVGLKMALAQLQRELRSAPSGANETKRLA